MPQTTLSAFVGKVAPRCKFVRSSEVNAFFAREVPDGAVLVTTVNLKLPAERVLLELYDARPTTAQALPVDELFVAHPRCLDAPLLLSNLQKAVRRGLATAAANTAWELAHCDLRALLRRVPIIAVEDVCSNRHLPWLTWLLVAVCSDRHRPTTLDVSRVVDYVYALATHMERLVVPPDPHDHFEKWWQQADARGDDVSLAILARAAYGGMDGDVNMLLRASTRDNTIAPTLSLEPLATRCRLRHEDLIPESVDFHVDNKLLHDLSMHLDGRVSTLDIKAAIWHCASKCNVRSAEGASLGQQRVYALILPSLEVRRARRIAAACRDP